MDPERLKRIAYALHPFLYKGGFGAVETDKIEERIGRIRMGLVPEQEFRAIATWLGNCIGIYGLDQTPMPVVTGAVLEKLEVPDFLAFVKYEGKILPVLIEVKSSEEKKLVWPEKYLTSLNKFAELLGLPLLVAWKWKIGWTLVDVAHFERKVTAYHLTIEKALEENLMALLMNEALYLLEEDVAFVWEAEILDCPVRQDELIPPGEHQFLFKGAFFSQGEKRLDEIPNGFAGLFFTCTDENEVRKVGGNVIQVICKPRSQTTPSLTSVLLGDMYLRSEGGDIDWDKELLVGTLPESGTYYRKVLDDGIKQGLVRYVMNQVPKTMPAFLK